MAFPSAGQVFITEMADPNTSTSGDARYVELYNAGASAVDLSTGWALRRWTNGNAGPQADVALTGTIPAGGFYLITNNAANFLATYGFAADQDIGAGGPADSNGDDQVALIDNSSSIVDIFGVPGEDGTGTCHEFEDGRAERIASVTSGTATWNEAEWNIWNDGPSGAVCTSITFTAQDAPGIFDPGAWIGAGGPSCGITLGTENASCNSTTTGPGNDTYDLSIPYTGVDAGTTVVNNSGSGTIGGDDPALVSNGTILISGISEDDAYSVTFTSPCDALTVSGAAPSCEPAPTVDLVINEVLSDPGTVVDANGDGTFSSTQDEFVEIVNNGASDVDLSGWALNDGAGLKHTFPGGSVVSAGCAVVVFGGGTPTGAFGGALVQTASSGGLGLNNGGDDIFLFDDLANLIVSLTYGSEGNNDQSITRDPDITGGTPLVQHSGAAGSGGALASPGTRVDGTSFSGCSAPACGITPGIGTATCNTFTAGAGNDTYDLTIPYSGVEAGTTVVNNSGSGTIGGDDPAVTPNGTIVISGISEDDAYSVTFSAPCDAFTISGSAPDCEPVPTSPFVINEIHADPDGTLGDANNDGTANFSDDEFVEIVNTGATDEDISDWTLSDGVGVRHVFPPGTVIPAGCAIVVFGGGTPNGAFGGVTVQTASTGALGLNNTGDDVILSDALAQVVVSVTYGAAGNNQSINLDPELTGSSFVDHSTIPAASGAIFSPGTLVDGTLFSGCTPPACGLTLLPESTVCNTVTSGPGDTYDLLIPYVGSQAGVTIFNFSGSGTVGGDDPAVVPNGTIVISGIDESLSYDLEFSAPCDLITLSGPAPICEPPPDYTVLVINEVDYDNAGSDTDEFVEILNTGAVDIDLTGLSLQLWNGSNTTVYNTIALDPVVLAAGDYFVVGSATVPNVDQVAWASNGLQNGDATGTTPDGLVLLDPTNAVIDGLSYEGDIAGVTEGSGAGLDDNTTGLPAYNSFSLSRIPDGTDTDQNNVDFQLRCVSPGEANSASSDFCVCTPAEAVISTNCIDDFSFNIVVDLSSLGGSSVVVISSDLYAYNQVALNTGQYILGPYLNNDVATITLGHDSNPLCDVVVAGITDDCTPAPPCTENEMTLTIDTDDYPDEITWEIVPAGGGTPVCSGGPYFVDFNTEIEACCLPNGCYELVFFDSFNDGIDAPGGYVLTDPDGDRVLISDGSYGGSGTAARPFCVPIGEVAITAANCDREDFLITENIECGSDAAVTAEWQVGDQTDDGYQFWFFDADGGFSRRITRTHASSGGFGPANATRACRLQLSSMVTNPLPFDRLLNVRVRPVVNGVFGEFGPSCLFRLLENAIACPTTQLIDDPNNPNFSCGVTRTFGGSDKVVAQPVAGANLYRFRFEQIGDAFARNITSPTYSRLLNWFTSPLVAGASYNVFVQASFDGGANWCPYGDPCQVDIVSPPAASRLGTDDLSNVNLWPNPNRGDQFQLTINDLPEEALTVNVDIHDLFGKRVAARTYPAQGGMLNTVVDLDGQLAAGMYVVSITAGDKLFTERLVIE